MDTGIEYHETIVVGGGQAGLATAKLLADRGRECLVVDGLAAVGDNWRRHYDSLRLYNPAAICGLPGMDFPAPGDHFPRRDEVAAFLAAYADRFDLPVRTSTWVREVTRLDDGYRVTTSGGVLQARNVVVATGTFGRPFTPTVADELDPSIHQLHSSQYRNPSDLEPGPVLVVGASHSGADLAFETAEAGHETVLVGRDTGELPVDIDGRLQRLITHLLPFVAARVLSLSTPIGRRMQPEVRTHGGPLLRIKRADLEAAGVERLTERVVGATGGRPRLDGGRVLDVANVLWCTGFRQDFSWIRPSVTGDDGWPREHLGVVEESPGLYFVGLAFQSSFASMLIVGAGRDARHVVDHIVDTRTLQRHAVPTGG